MMSWRGRFVAWVLPLTGIKRGLADEETFRRRVLSQQRRGPALPSWWMRRRFSVTETQVQGARVFTVAPRRTSGRNAFLYLHGGAYVTPILRSHWSLVSRLVAETGSTAVVPLYPLAPAHTCEAVFRVVRQVYEDLIAKMPARDIVIIGDSAGGGLALSLAMQLRDDGRPLPASLVLICPGLDMTFGDPRQPDLAKRDPLLDIPGLRAAGRWYAGALSPADPKISPLFGSLAGLPRIAVFTGTKDLLNPDAHRLRSLAARDGVALWFREYPDMFHDWPLAPIPEARRVVEEIGRFVASAPAE